MLKGWNKLTCTCHSHRRASTLKISIMLFRDLTDCNIGSQSCCIMIIFSASVEKWSTFGVSLALALLALSLLTLLHSGYIPLSSVIDEREAHAPYRMPTVRVTTAYHVACLIKGWGQYDRSTGYGGSGAGGSGAVLLVIGMIASGTLAAFGGWCLMFASGADAEGKERVSGWPFRNEEEKRVKREKMAGKKFR